MIVKNIHYTKIFLKELGRLPKNIVRIASQKEVLFKQNPLHPSLRLHELHGKLQRVWSLTVTGSYRIIFKRMENGDILFFSIGKHDIYKNL